VNTSGGGRHTGTPRTANGGVEAVLIDGSVVLRASNDPDGPELTFTPAEWEAFVGGVRLGEFGQSLLAITKRGEDTPPVVLPQPATSPDFSCVVRSTKSSVLKSP
jgi:Domain of unknown function (DUF397)